MSELNELLNFDSIAEAERLAGTSYKESDAVTWLGLGLMQEKNKRLNAILSERKDSLFSNTLTYYEMVIAEEGFVKVLELPIVGTEDTFFIYWHPDGILLKFDSYNGRSVNGGNFYYNWKPNENADWSVLSSHSGRVDGIIAGDHDCREAIRYHIQRLREEGTFLNPWVKRPFLWLLHYMDTKTEGYDYKSITAERIAMLPEYVQSAIVPVCVV